MSPNAQQDNQKLLHQISGVLTEISHNISLVRPSWPEGRFSIWINGFLDLYERTSTVDQKTQVLEMLAEDVEMFKELKRQEDAAEWQCVTPFTSKDGELEGILLRIASFIRRSQLAATAAIMPACGTVR